MQLVAGMACETGIAPDRLLAQDPVMFWAMARYLKDRTMEARR